MVYMKKYAILPLVKIIQIVINLNNYLYNYDYLKVKQR